LKSPLNCKDRIEIPVEFVLRTVLKSHFPGEAVVVQLHVERLLAAGLRQTAVAVITPYNAQVGGTRSGCVG
jgi:superfamily I DNA and/or RNA helicase